MKIWFLARSYYPYQQGGGSIIRVGQVNSLQKLGWDITVVLPNYLSKNLIIKKNIIQIPFKTKHIQKLASLLERVGVYDDYLDKWVGNAHNYLKDRIQKEDIVFATSGGELGMIKLGSLLKDRIGCKFVVNFHDPINYGYMNGLRRDKKPHVGREKPHKKYISNADLILTSSQYYADVLSNKFTDLSHKIHNNYFGYIDKLNAIKFQKKTSNKLSIAYVGAMSNTQSPELLYKAWKELNDPDIEIYFIGDIGKYKALNSIKEKGVYFIDSMPHDKFLKFMMKNIDVGFVSLSNDYFGACVPSKIYEYINLGLPILGALPNGDGTNIINQNQYGVACDYSDIESLKCNIQKMKDNDFLKKIKKYVLKDRDKWHIESRIKEINALLKNL